MAYSFYVFLNRLFFFYIELFVVFIFDLLLLRWVVGYVF